MGERGYCQQELGSALEESIRKTLRMEWEAIQKRTIGIQAQKPVLLLLAGLKISDQQLVMISGLVRWLTGRKWSTRSHKALWAPRVGFVFFDHSGCWSWSDEYPGIIRKLRTCTSSAHVLLHSSPHLGWRLHRASSTWWVKWDDWRSRDRMADYGNKSETENA